MASWTAEQVAAAKQWVAAWRRAGEAMETLRREELISLDTREAAAALCIPADYTRPPFAPEPTSGLVEQPRWFALARACP